MRAHVLAIESEQVERKQEHCPRAAATSQCRVQAFKVRQAALVDHHALPALRRAD
jgi:hypothetical protein